MGEELLNRETLLKCMPLAKVNATTNNFYYIDTIRAGTQYINGSIRLITNEGVSFSGSGPYTNASNDDAGVYDCNVSPDPG